MHFFERAIRVADVLLEALHGNYSIASKFLRAFNGSLEAF